MLDLHEGILEEFTESFHRGEYHDKSINVVSRSPPARESLDKFRHEVHAMVDDVLSRAKQLPKIREEEERLRREARILKLNTQARIIAKKRNKRRTDRKREILRWIMMCGD